MRARQSSALPAPSASTERRRGSASRWPDGTYTRTPLRQFASLRATNGSSTEIREPKRSRTTSPSVPAAAASGITTGGPSAESTPGVRPPITPSEGSYASSSSPERSVNSHPFCFCVGSGSSRAKEAPFRRLSTSHSGSAVATGALANRSFHLELDQPVHLHRVLHRELLGDRLDEAIHDHLRGLLLVEAVRLEVEELL